MESAKKGRIHRGNSIISIEVLPDYVQPVVIKKASRSHASPAIQSLEVEYEMTRALDAVEGVRKALGQQSIDDQPALILEYIEGETLRDHIASHALGLRSRLEIAIALTRILAGIHRENIIHLDLSSRNILIAGEERAVHLIDLSSASRIDADGHQKVQPDRILGELPYIAPEQTGRVNRAVDERSDLYSLGVVLYELMTRQLPFDSDDPAELIHYHIAWIPVSPSRVSAEIPEVISEIILKLLSKQPEDRYQSAAGVLVDLEKCLQRLSPDGTIEGFPVGQADHPGRVVYPRKLYGRERELKELVSAFEGACRETSSMMFVSGYSGVGKTALVEELQRPVSEERAHILRGKFDQYLRTTPYSGVTQALDGFVSQILAEPEESFGEWKERIGSAVGDLGKVLTDVFPAMERLIGVQPAVPLLEGHEAENRFHYVFMKFLSAIAAEERPLVLFLDDLQWIDAASLRLLRAIRSDIDQPGLLVVGAYRDNEVDESHPLMTVVGGREETGIPLQTLKLDDLQPETVETFLSDALRAPHGVEDLSAVLYDKSHGNPFFVRRLLTSLREQGRFRYDPKEHRWDWNISDIRAAAVADNVADLLAKALDRLPEETRGILTLAACIGNRFEIATLAKVSGLAEGEVIGLLASGVSGQCVFQLDGAYAFVHDQVQQAAYDLIDAESRTRKHLEIGRTLLADTRETELEERIFDIVAHFNLSAHLLADRAERLELARLNLVAGRKARQTAAFAASAAYL
jgi:serine/threonine protein kinase